MMGMTFFAVPIFAVNKHSKEIRVMMIRKKCLAFLMALVMVLGIGMAKAPAVFADSVSSSSVSASGAQSGQEEEEERPYWLLVVAIFFFISVTTGVTAVVIYTKKSAKKPDDDEIKDNKEE